MADLTRKMAIVGLLLSAILTGENVQAKLSKNVDMDLGKVFEDLVAAGYIEIDLDSGTARLNNSVLSVLRHLKITSDVEVLEALACDWTTGKTDSIN